MLFMLCICCEDLAEGSHSHCFATACPHTGPWHKCQCWNLPVITLHLLHFFSHACSEALGRRLAGSTTLPMEVLVLGTAVAGPPPPVPYQHITHGQENPPGDTKRVAFFAPKSLCETVAIHSLLVCDVWWWTVVATKLYSSGQEKARERFATQRHLPLCPPPGCGCWMLMVSPHATISLSLWNIGTEAWWLAGLAKACYAVSTRNILRRLVAWENLECFFLTICTQWVS